MHDGTAQRIAKEGPLGGAVLVSAPRSITAVPRNRGCPAART